MITEFLLPLNIRDTVRPCLNTTGDKWSRTISGTDYSLKKKANNIELEAQISRWYYPSRRYFEISGKLKIYKYHQDTVQVEENTYTFKIENALNQSNRYSLEEDQEDYLDEKVLEIIGNMNAIIASIDYLKN